MAKDGDDGRGELLVESGVDTAKMNRKIVGEVEALGGGEAGVVEVLRQQGMEIGQVGRRGIEAVAAKDGEPRRFGDERLGGSKIIFQPFF